MEKNKIILLCLPRPSHLQISQVRGSARGPVHASPKRFFHAHTASSTCWRCSGVSTFSARWTAPIAALSSRQTPRSRVLSSKGARVRRTDFFVWDKKPRVSLTHECSKQHGAAQTMHAPGADALGTVRHRGGAGKAVCVGEAHVTPRGRRRYRMPSCRPQIRAPHMFPRSGGRLMCTRRCDSQTSFRPFCN